MHRPHRVVIVAFPDVELLDVTGPAEVFSVASRIAGSGRPGYRVEIATADGGPFTTSSGVRLLADLRLDQVEGRVDTLLVSGAVTHREGGGAEAVVDPVVAQWLRTAAPAAGRSGSVCAGAHVLAAAGLLAVLLVLDRAPLPLLAYTAVLMVIAFGGAGYFESKPRFLLPAFPLLLPLAAAMAKARPRTAVMVTAVLAGLSYCYGLYLLLGAKVPL